MAEFKLYTKTDCLPCKELKEKLDLYGIEYNEFIIGKDISREELLEKFPEARVTPVIEHTVSGIMIGSQAMDMIITARKVKR